MKNSILFAHPLVAIALLIVAGSSQPETLPGELRPASCAIIGDRVFFDIGNTDLRPDAMDQIIRTVDFFMTYPAEIKLEGHTDAHFPEEKNEEVGWSRAETVRDAFIARGYPFELLHTFSYGGKRPAVLGENENAWAQNRRVVFVVKEFLVAPPEIQCGEG